MNKYKQLIFNTALFALGNFTTKLILFLLVPLYTSVLTQKEFGVSDLLNTSIELLIPLFTLSVADAAFRFAIDKEYNRISLFSNSILIIFSGTVILIFLTPLLSLFISQEYHVVFIVLYFTSAIKTLFSQFVRGIGLVKIFTLNGVIAAVVLLLANVFFLSIFNMGIYGFLFAIITSNIAASIYMFIFANLYKYFSYKAINKVLMKDMLTYSVFLIPNALSWWITNMSGKYIIVGYYGVAAAGLFAAANKLPSLINLISTIFYKAWQLSSAEEYGSKGSEEFYSNVFKYYSAVILISGSGIIAVTPFISKFILSGEFYQGWVYVPFMMLTAIFGCYVTFFGTIYSAAKKNFMGMITTLIGSGLNIGLNFIFIPIYGPISAAVIGTFSFAIVAILRVFDTRKLQPIMFDWKSLSFSLLIMIVQSLILTLKIRYSMIYSILLAIVVFVLNIKTIREILLKIYNFISRKKELN